MAHEPHLFIGPTDPLQDHPRYSSLRLLSAGSRGVVVLAYDTTDREYVAVKLIERLVSLNEPSVAVALGKKALCCKNIVAFSVSTVLDASLESEAAMCSPGDVALKHSRL